MEHRNPEYKAAFDLIKKDPDQESRIEELHELGITNVKYKMVKQTRIVYEFDGTTIYVRMFISTRIDFRRHLLKRLFS
jgi:hypothetical protein